MSNSGLCEREILTKPMARGHAVQIVCSCGIKGAQFYYERDADKERTEQAAQCAWVHEHWTAHEL